MDDIIEGFRMRTATMDDLDAVRRLNTALFRKEIDEYDGSLDISWPEGELGEDYYRRSIVDEDACTLVAVDDGTGEVIGYIIGWKRQKAIEFRMLENQGIVENMFVLEEYRSMGVGGMLISGFERWCRDRGIVNMTVTASVGNGRGIAFYRRNGFGDYELTLEKDLR